MGSQEQTIRTIRFCLAVTTTCLLLLLLSQRPCWTLTGGLSHLLRTQIPGASASKDRKPGQGHDGQGGPVGAKLPLEGCASVLGHPSGG